MNPRDPWAIHAVTHVFEMQGRHRAGAAWLQGRLQDSFGIDHVTLQPESDTRPLVRH